MPWPILFPTGSGDGDVPLQAKSPPVQPRSGHHYPRLTPGESERRDFIKSAQP
jgi:hypothetical protein